MTDPKVTLMSKEEIEALVELEKLVRVGSVGYAENRINFNAALTRVWPKLIAQALRCASLAEELEEVKRAKTEIVGALKRTEVELGNMLDNKSDFAPEWVEIMEHWNAQIRNALSTSKWDQPLSVQTKLEQAEQELQQLKSHSSLARSGEVPTTESTDYPFGSTLDEMDTDAFFNMRAWLRDALEAKGAKQTGAGVGLGQADIDIELEGMRYNVSIKPLR